MVLRIRCEICGSRKWHRLDGNQVCEDGHILAGTMDESSQLQPGESSAFMFATRRLHSTGGKRKARGTTHDHFHGERQTFLLFQCLQWVLREQLRIMIDELGYPQQLEGCAKELWSMLVVSSRLPNAPKKFHEDDEAVGSYSGMKEPEIGKNRLAKVAREKAAKKRKLETSASGEKNETAKLSGGDGGHERERSRSKTTDDDEEEDSDSEGDGIQTEDHQETRRSTDPHDSPKLDFTLSILYLACLTLRIPVMFYDIVSLAINSKIPFMNARRWLLPSMQEHLTPSSTRILSMNNPPDILAPNGIIVSLNRLASLYKQDWKIIFPEPNFKIITWRLCRALACSPLIYTTTLRLLSRVPTFTLALIPPSPSSRDTNGKIIKREWKKSDAKVVGSRTELAEVTILAAIGVVIKLVYGMGEAELYQQCPDQITLLDQLPPFKEWIITLEALSQIRESDAFPSRLWKMPASEMSGSEIDSFIQFCEDTYAPLVKPPEMAIIDRLFIDPNPFVQPSSSIHSPSHSDEMESLIQSLYSSVSFPQSRSRSHPNANSPEYNTDNREDGQPRYFGVFHHHSPPLPSLAKFLSLAAPIVGHTAASLLSSLTALEYALRHRSRSYSLSRHNVAHEAGYEETTEEGARREMERQRRRESSMSGEAARKRMEQMNEVVRDTMRARMQERRESKIRKKERGDRERDEDAEGGNAKIERESEEGKQEEIEVLPRIQNEAEEEGQSDVEMATVSSGRGKSMRRLIIESEEEEEEEVEEGERAVDFMGNGEVHRGTETDSD